MKTMIKTSIIALILLAGASAAQAGDGFLYSGHADWAQTALDAKG